MHKQLRLLIPCLILIFIFFLPVELICKEPTSAEVKTELHKILEKMGIKKEAQPDTESGIKENLFVKFIRFLADLIKGIMRFLGIFGPFMLILLIGGFLLLIFLLLRKIIPGFRKDKLPGSAQTADPAARREDLRLTPSAGLHREAEAAAARGDYNRAVELLHKASIAVLREEEILAGSQDYTNNEVRSLLPDSYSTAFHAITSSAERVTFRYDTVNAAQYSVLLADYRSAFNRSSP